MTLWSCLERQFITLWCMNVCKHFSCGWCTSRTCFRPTVIYRLSPKKRQSSDEGCILRTRKNFDQIMSISMDLPLHWWKNGDDFGFYILYIWGSLILSISRDMLIFIIGPYSWKRNENSTGISLTTPWKLESYFHDYTHLIYLSFVLQLNFNSSSGLKLGEVLKVKSPLCQHVFLYHSIAKTAWKINLSY